MSCLLTLWWVAWISVAGALAGTLCREDKVNQRKYFQNTGITQELQLNMIKITQYTLSQLLILLNFTHLLIPTFFKTVLTFLF